jgi:NAD(P)H-nitrite reductase large subunit
MKAFFLKTGAVLVPMADYPEGAILQRDGITYAVLVRSPGGLVTPELLERVAAIARKYRVPTVKLTSGQRIDLIGIQKEDLAGVFEELGPDAVRKTGPCIRFVQSCPGIRNCKNGTQDSLGLAITLEAQYREQPLPGKVKIGISGCPRSCGMSHTRDIGIHGTPNGWTVLFGGNNGIRPRFGEVVAKDLTTGEVQDLVSRLLAYYQKNARPKERTARLMERITMDTLKRGLTDIGPFIPLEK